MMSAAFNNRPDVWISPIRGLTLRTSVGFYDEQGRKLKKLETAILFVRQFVQDSKSGRQYPQTKEVMGAVHCCAGTANEAINHVKNEHTAN